MKEIFNALSGLSAEWSINITRFLATVIIALAVGFVCWLFGAIGIYAMSKRQGLKYPWLSFIYPVYPLTLGRVAQKYIKKNGVKSANFSVWLLVLSIARFVLTASFFAVGALAVFKIVTHALNAIEADVAMTPDMFSSAIPAIILYFVAITVLIAYLVMYYIALWRIFAIFNYEYATLFLILSIFISVLAPIFIFIIRNKIPKYNSQEVTDNASFQLVEEYGEKE